MSAVACPTRGPANNTSPPVTMTPSRRDFQGQSPLPSAPALALMPVPIAPPSNAVAGRQPRHLDSLVELVDTGE
jgi:hypothetical protein